MREFYASKYANISITEQEFKKEFFFLGIDIDKVNLKLKKLSFITINKKQQIYIYSLNLTKYETYMTTYNNGGLK
jgi:hypothetical protein